MNQLNAIPFTFHSNYDFDIFFFVVLFISYHRSRHVYLQSKKNKRNYGVDPMGSI